MNDKEYQRKYREKHKDKLKQNAKFYYINNKDKWIVSDKEALKIRRQKHYLSNRERLLNYAKEYRESHRLLINSKRREKYNQNPDREKTIYKKSYEKNKKKWLPKKVEYISKKRKTDKIYYLKDRIRKKLYLAFKLYSDKGKLSNSDEYGIDYNAIIEHLKPFPNNIEDYHIDHIRPLCTFDFNDLEQIKQAFAPENHQWLLAKENLSKGGKWNGI